MRPRKPWIVCLSGLMIGSAALANGEIRNNQEDEQKIASSIRKQEAAWNRGDIDEFMEGYWKSPKLTFSSGGSTTRGWQETLDRYHASYDTRDKMGELKFDGLEISMLGDNVALVLGTWHLERGAESMGGNFSLVWKKIDDKWVIIHDHTSSLEDDSDEDES